MTKYAMRIDLGFAKPTTYTLGKIYKFTYMYMLNEFEYHSDDGRRFRSAIDVVEDAPDKWFEVTEEDYNKQTEEIEDVCGGRSDSKVYEDWLNEFKKYLYRESEANSSAYTVGKFYKVVGETEGHYYVIDNDGARRKYSKGNVDNGHSYGWAKGTFSEIKINEKEKEEEKTYYLYLKRAAIVESPHRKFTFGKHYLVVEYADYNDKLIFYDDEGGCSAYSLENAEEGGYSFTLIETEEPIEEEIKYSPSSVDRWMECPVLFARVGEGEIIQPGTAVFVGDDGNAYKCAETYSNGYRKISELPKEPEAETSYIAAGDVILGWYLKESIKQKGVNFMKESAKKMATVGKHYLAIRTIEFAVSTAFPELNMNKLKKAIRVVSKKGFGVVLDAVIAAGPAVIGMATTAVNKVLDIITEDENGED